MKIQPEFFRPCNPEAAINPTTKDEALIYRFVCLANTYENGIAIKSPIIYVAYITTYDIA